MFRTVIYVLTDNLFELRLIFDELKANQIYGYSIHRSKNVILYSLNRYAKTDMCACVIYSMHGS